MSGLPWVRFAYDRFRLRYPGARNVESKVPMWTPEDEANLHRRVQAAEAAKLDAAEAELEAGGGVLYEVRNGALRKQKRGQ